MENRLFTVYRHTSPSGKVYIGITCQDVRNRWQNGKTYKDSTHFKRAIRKSLKAKSYRLGNFLG